MQAVWWASQRVGWTEARVIFAKKTNRCVSLKCTARLPGVFSVSLRCLLTPRWLLGVSQVSCHQVAGSKSHLWGQLPNCTQLSHKLSGLSHKLVGADDAKYIFASTGHHFAIVLF